MTGLKGTKIDWKGEDRGWYVLVFDDPDLEVSVRLTAPLPDKFPDRQLITGFAIKYEGGHSIVIVDKRPYTTETNGCPDEEGLDCLAENALQVIVDANDLPSTSIEGAAFPGSAVLSAINFPAECPPYGGDQIWAETFAAMTERRHLTIQEQSLKDWVSTWSASTAAPSWCEKYLRESSLADVL